MKRAFSFDIFDTLLTRKVGSPASLFLIVGDRAVRTGIGNFTAATFQAQRMNAELEARSSAPGSEAAFAEIYQILVAKLGLSQSFGEALAQLELTVESELLVPVPGALELVQSVRENSEGVLFVSDMYLPAPYLRSELAKHGFWRDIDKLYVSNQWRASKSDGTLFRKILENERLLPEAIHHTGDRKDADFEIPSKLGIKARHLDVCHLMRYEQMLDEFSVESSGFSSLIAGISRLTRLRVPTSTNHLSVLSQIASSLISPVITSYVLWILRETRQQKIGRLYFVARDGYLVKKIADALIKALNLSIETRYLYGSRQAWHLPAITDFSPTALSWLFEKTRTLSLRIVLSRLQIVPEQVVETLGSLGWSESSWDQPADDEALARMKVDLLGSPDFRAHVEKLVAEKRVIALRYLEQEGLFDPIPWAIVDLGWHGRLQLSLEKLLAMKQPSRTCGLYFGLYADSPALSTLQTDSYLGWDLRNPPEGKEIPALVFLLESFCTAPHGSTVGYKMDGNCVVPVCREGGFAPLEAWGIETVHATVEHFASELEKLSLSEQTLNWDSRPAITRILGTFSRNPLASEARAWGSFPYEDEQGGAVRERLTKSYDLSWENIRAALTFGEQQFLPTSWEVLWHGGQLHAPSAGSAVLRLALKIGRAKRKIGDRIRFRLGGLTSKSPKAMAAE